MANATALMVMNVRNPSTIKRADPRLNALSFEINMILSFFSF